METTLFLDTTPAIFAAWLEQKTRLVYVTDFPTDKGRIALQTSRYNPATGLVSMPGVYITPTNDASEQAIPLPDLIVFRIVRLAPERIEVAVRCDQPALQRYCLELLAEIAQRWGEPKGIRISTQAVPPTTLSPNPHEALARKLEVWQKQYYDEVDSAFARQDRSRGEAAFASWEPRFLEFLRRSAPSLEPIFDKTVKKRSASRLANLTHHQNWKRHKGNALEAFITQAILDARAERLPFPPAANADHKTSRSSEPFISRQLIAGLRAPHQSPFDTARIVTYCEEINDNYERAHYSSVAFLSRAVLDHCPPVFGQPNFESVVAHIGRASRDPLERLDKSLKGIANAHLHKQITQREVPPILQEIQFQSELNHLVSLILARLGIPPEDLISHAQRDDPTPSAPNLPT
jgi:hypothetical protein